MQKVTVILYRHFCREAKRGRLYHDINNPEKRTQLALGVDRASFFRWIRQDFESTEVKQGRKRKVDDFDKDVIRREILKMFAANQLVTLRKLKVKLQSECDIEISKTALWKVVRGTGFTFRKSAGGRNIVCEKPHLIAARSKYLRQIRERRMEGYDIVYLDESWVNAHHTYEKEWQSVDREQKRKIPSSKGQRIILAHAGSSENGLVHDAELIFQAKSTDGRDYHTEMNGHIFRDWIENTLLPTLDRPSCLVMDNASYHNVVAQEDKVPTASSTKGQIRTWLVKENVRFDDTYLKPELLQLVRQTKKTKVYQIDKIIEEQGHTSLRLPAYHSHLNPIELVWAKVKGQVAAQNTTFKMNDVKVLTRDALSKIDIEYWEKCVEHVLREEEEYWQRDGLQFIQPITVVNLLESSDSE
jgi:transposase